MDIEEIRKLSANEQRKELGILRKKFEQERETLKQKIHNLESLKKEKESIAGGLATSEKRETLAEVSLIAGSIKNIKNEILGRNKELDFLGKAIAQAEKLLKASEEQSIKEEKILDTILIRLLRETELRDIRQDELSRQNADLEELTRKREKKDLEETVETEAVKTAKKKEPEPVREYIMRDDLVGKAKDKPYIPTVGSAVEQSQRAYARNISDEQKTIAPYIHAPVHDTEYMTKRQQEEERQRAVQDSDARRVLEEKEEFIRDESTKHKKTNIYSR